MVRSHCIYCCTLCFIKMNIKIASSADAERITRLRTEAYTVATGTKLIDNTFLQWSTLDEQSIVLYVEDDFGQALSSMRSIKVDDAPTLEALFDIRLPAGIEFPVLAMDRLVTLIDYRRMRLTGNMRQLMLQACLNAELPNLVITIQEGASRIEFLTVMGYRFEPADVSHRTTSSFKNSSQALFGCLNHLNYPQALAHNESILKVPMESFTVAPSVYSTIHQSLTGNTADPVAPDVVEDPVP